LTFVLVVLVDALRYDFVNEKDTPFTHNLGMQGIKLPLKPILGYSDAIRATIFTGTYPDRHGYWMSYCYSPATSPFKRLKWLRFVDYVPSDLMKRGTKFLVSLSVMKLLAKLTGYSNLHLHNMPFRTIDRFDVTLRKRMTDPGVFPRYPTIFDVLRAHGMKFAYLDSSKLKRRLLSEVGKLTDETKLVFIYLHYIDEAAHWFGLESSHFERTLRTVDSILQQIVFVAKKKFGDSLAVVVFSDHGMVEGKEVQDLSWLMGIDGFGRDFFLSLDATMVRVWCERRDMRQYLVRLISSTGKCKLLSDSEKKDLNIAFNGRLFGDDIFLLDEGQIIFPNFYSYIKPKAMHAYDPSSPTQHGIFILNDHQLSTAENIMDEIELIDIGPTIFSLLGVSIPSTFEGKSRI